MEIVSRTTITPVVEQLPGGMRILLVPSTANNIVATVCFMPLPAIVERAEDAGIVHFTHGMLLRGTRKRGSAELSEAIESLGTALGSDSADDYSYSHMVSTRDTFEESLRLLAEVMQEPSFEPEEIEKERQSTLAAIRRQDDDKFSYTLRHLMRELYGGHSYGLPRLGLEDTVNEFRREQMVGIHEEWFDPSTYLMVCVGNFDADQTRNLVQEVFKPRTLPAAHLPQSAPPIVYSSRHQLTRDCEQAFLAIGYRACSVLSDDFPAVRVLNGVLGEGMSSRFFTKLRDEQGLAYATGSSYGGYRCGGHIVGYIGTKPETLDVARDGMQAEFERMKEELVPAEELDRAKNYIIGKFLIDHQTNYKRAYYLGLYETMGLGLQMDDEYPKRIAGVTGEQVREAANRYLVKPVIVELVPEREKTQPE